ncbi:hypothetical protein CU102_12400 [Phyllobacterium brassicacearum]|uniref:Uncharacterized protein n=1 Tax=Phyllobacterium brassicacearum TaxID=314235 RepID=A0A2P7BQ05_9HYPH|nr:hypothetical protein [Phyllobacterium brassicacearum]PSH68558.1 hypothetical protein CU102_12400 [Phyllobacterium brassicacearum]TDQ19907.1 hypothetical protein DEV91_124102 [Phyllobacterium brassicacearum]
MMHTFETKLEQSIHCGDDHSFDLQIKFEFTKGEPESGAGYLADPAHYDPGSDHDVTIKSIMLIVGDQPETIPVWMDTLIRNDHDLRGSMIEYALEQESR